MRGAGDIQQVTPDETGSLLHHQEEKGRDAAISQGQSDSKKQKTDEQKLVAAIFVLLTTIGAIGNILIWASGGSDGSSVVVPGTPFFNVLLATILFSLCTVRNATIPATFSGVTRKFSTVLLASNLDQCLCTCHAIVVGGSHSSLEEETTRHSMLKAGTVMAASGAIGAFILASCAAGTSMPGVGKRIANVKNGVGLLAGAVTLVAQVIICSVADPCSYLPGGLFFSPSVPLIVAIVTLTAHMFDVKPVQDMALVFFINFILVALPVFEPNALSPGVSSAVSAAWHWSTWMIFVSGIFYVIGVLYTTFLNRTHATYSNHCHEKSTVSRALHAVFASVGLAGGIMVLCATADEATFLSRQVCIFEAVVGVTVPLLCVWSEFSKFDGGHLVALILSVIAGGQLAYPTQIPYLPLQPSPSLYMRCAFVLLTLSVVVTPLIRYTVSSPSTAAAAGGFSGSARRRGLQAMTLLCLLCAAWSFSSGFALKEPYKWPFFLFPCLFQFAVLIAFAPWETNTQRVVYFFAMIFSLNGAIWPLAAPDASPSAVQAALAVCGLSAVVVYSLDTPGAYFTVVHATAPSAGEDRNAANGP